jgi:hypothetical protein
MKVKTSQDTVEKLIELREQFDASTEQFLDNLPTPEKYAILAMTLVVHGGYDDYEIAHDDAMHKVSAQDLTKHLLKYPFLECHLKDALKLKWSYFEVLHTDDCEDDEENES